MDFVRAQAILKTTGVEIDAGLTTEEFIRVEERFGFRFPPDLREFLTVGLPISPGWIDWRHAPDTVIRESLAWPFEGMRFDIERNSFWIKDWGSKPRDLDAAVEIARGAVEGAPILIPICGHRYIPGDPNEAGNPVFSVHQTDIIYYGSDLMDYLHNEFRYNFGRAEYAVTGEPKSIRFWSALAG